MKIKVITFILSILLLSCDKGMDKQHEIENSNKKIEEYFAIVSHISNMSRSYNNRLDEILIFIEQNHLSDPCANEINHELLNLIDLIDSAQSHLVNYGGGMDENGRFVGAESTVVITKFIKKFNLNQRIEKKLTKIEQSNELNYPYSNMIINRIEEDLSMIYPLEETDQIYQHSLISVFNRMLDTKISLIFTEIIYYEMLKSNVDCRQKS